MQIVFSLFYRYYSDTCSNESKELGLDTLTKLFVPLRAHPFVADYPVNRTTH